MRVLVGAAAVVVAGSPVWSQVPTYRVDVVETKPKATGPARDWVRLNIPTFGTEQDIVVDADAFGGPVHLLVASKDNIIIGGDQHYHVLRREGNGWMDLGEPDVSDIEAMSFGNEGVVWTSVAVGPDDSLWIGGEFEPLAQVDRGYQRPVFARWQPGTGWSTPEPLVLLPVTVYPFTPRGGTIYDMDVAPDGSVFASGIASGWGGLTENNGIIPMLLTNAGAGWREVNVPDRDWPGSRGVTDGNGVIAFGADDAIMAGRHPGGNGVGQGALIATYTSATGPVFVETPAYGGNTGHVANDLDAFSPLDIWVVGEGSVVGDTALFMHFDGTDWTQSPSPFASITFMEDVVLGPDGTGWAFTGLVTAPDGTPTPQAFYDGASWSLANFLGGDVAGESLQVLSASLDGDGFIWAVGRSIFDSDLADPFNQVSFSPFVAVLGGCELRADINNDGVLTGSDFNAWLSAFGAGDPTADQNGDGVLTGADFNAFLVNFLAGCP